MFSPVSEAGRGPDGPPIQKRREAYATPPPTNSIPTCAANLRQCVNLRAPSNCSNCNGLPSSHDLPRCVFLKIGGLTMEALTPDGWLTRQEAAARLGIGLRTLDWQRARGEHGPLVYFVRVGGRRRLLYSERALERYVGRRKLRDASARTRLIAA